MAYNTIMDNLLAEFRAVQKIQAQDAQVIKQLSSEEKTRLSLVQKLIKAYLAGEPEDVVLGLLGGNGLAKLTAIQNGGEIERLYQKLKILLEVETIDLNRYNEEAVLAQAKEIIGIKAEDYEAYQKEFAKLDKKASDYKRYAALAKRLKKLSQNGLTTLQYNAGFVIKRTEGLADWLKKAEEHNKLFEKHKLVRFESNWRWVIPSEELCQVIKEVLMFSKAGMLEAFAEFGFKKPVNAGEIAFNFVFYIEKHHYKLESVLTRLDLKKFEDLQLNPALPDDGLTEYIPMPDLPLFRQGEKDADAIDLNDIAQGSVGDCYALAALGAVAYAQPKLIREAIQEVKGGYKVRLYLKKEDESTATLWVYVDNQFPVRKDCEPAFAKKGDGELWVMVFEKALAKLAGGYKVLDKGKPEDVIFMLTGKVQVTNDLEGLKEPCGQVWEDLVKKLSEANGERLVCTLSSCSGNKFQFPLCKLYGEIGQNGEPLCVVDDRYVYIGNHAYTIVGYDASTKRIEVRNPHGRFPQKLRIALLEGNFSESYINKLSYGKFFMTKNEFVELVSKVTWP